MQTILFTDDESPDITPKIPRKSCVFNLSKHSEKRPHGSGVKEKVSFVEY
jgi:hypothetical protein